jgi:hypothetical protein
MIRCVLCAVELEGFPEPLCVECRASNYVVQLGNTWVPFTNDGRLIRAAIGSMFPNVVFMGSARRRPARRPPLRRNAEHRNRKHIATIDPAAYAKMTPEEKQLLVDQLYEKASETGGETGLPPLKKPNDP